MPRLSRPGRRNMKTFHCDHCQHLVFFENTRCENCGHALGYLEASREIIALEAGPGDTWHDASPRVPAARPRNTAPGPQHDHVSSRDRPDDNAPGRRTLYRKCYNYAVQNVCNWMVPAESPHQLCSACRLTRTIPALTSQLNHSYWYRIELAKRRLLYTLAMLQLPVVSKRDAPRTGLAFQFLEDTSGKRVMTGHDTGLVTLNIAEADDVRREQARTRFNEPYRTLLGHLRHEVGHYYFDRLIANTHWVDSFRSRFGDERIDYSDSLARHYRDGPPADWRATFVSAYATAHPWEDWAETWAHYLHMFDALDTADACGMALLPNIAGEPSLPVANRPAGRPSFEEMIERWLPLTYVLNSLNRSLGMPDGYPFALSAVVIEKLRFVHQVIGDGAQRSEAS